MATCIPAMSCCADAEDGSSPCCSTGRAHAWDLPWKMSAPGCSRWAHGSQRLAGATTRYSRATSSPVAWSRASMSERGPPTGSPARRTRSPERFSITCRWRWTTRCPARGERAPRRWPASGSGCFAVRTSCGVERPDTTTRPCHPSLGIEMRAIIEREHRRSATPPHDLRQRRVGGSVEVPTRRAGTVQRTEHLTDDSRMRDQRDALAAMRQRQRMDRAQTATPELAVALPARPPKPVVAVPRVGRPELRVPLADLRQRRPVQLAAVDLLQRLADPYGAEPRGGQRSGGLVRPPRRARVDGGEWRALAKSRSEPAYLVVATRGQRRIGTAAQEPVFPVARGVGVPNQSQSCEHQGRLGSPRGQPAPTATMGASYPARLIACHRGRRDPSALAAAGTPSMASASWRGDSASRNPAATS